MNKIQIKSVILRALKDLKQNDSYSIEHQTHEVSINHRLAVYLERRISNMGMKYDVDIEYNKNIGNIERGNPKVSDGFKIRPDIIVHKRGSEIDNELIIETKKRRRYESNIKDKNKIENALSYPLNYKFGLYIQYKGPKKKIITHFIEKINGRIISEMQEI